MNNNIDSAKTRPVLNRRDFLFIMTSLAAVSPMTLLAASRQQPVIHYTDEPWKTLDAVFEHLFPAADGAPGARELRVISYMQTMLNAPDTDPDDLSFTSNGVGWLNDLSQQEYKKLFIDLDETHREQILRKIETSSAGERWLSFLLTHLLEALLSDPVYGSNPYGIGWDWLEHQSGYPLPTTDTMYYKLHRRVQRNTKA
ncbi:MAG TPA: gluconate 2-dehydrogenase subunit 3 family protein [Gammaproteobacteria bacterium]|nr:gluconate 2-dehydrogenase subunit 3 family protein [Gammaproteobacteria bacterium]